VTNFKEHLPSLRLRMLAGLAAVALVALVAGCGSSGSSSTITVGNENKADEKLATATSSESSTTATTPTTGILAHKPKVIVPPGPPPTTLQKKDLLVGTGAEAKAGDPVTVNYVGALYKGGTEFDSSWKRNEPFKFVLGKHQVISGWDEGIAGMKVGGRRELIIPASLAYGAKGSPPTIPPNSTLIFVVDLLGV
jgi:peptidylprolyl isomerase